jgi:molybdopterin/thiamine biosynthesis adenylyltransferase
MSKAHVSRYANIYKEIGSYKQYDSSELLFFPQVARETMLKLNPTLNIVSHHKNIKEEEFGILFFKQFDIIITALDNAEARSYVNNICVTLNKPLLEAGTTGYAGQVFIIRNSYKCIITLFILLENNFSTYRQ